MISQTSLSTRITKAISGLSHFTSCCVKVDLYPKNHVYLRIYYDQKGSRANKKPEHLIYSLLARLRIVYFNTKSFKDYFEVILIYFRNSAHNSILFSYMVALNESLDIPYSTFK